VLVYCTLVGFNRLSILQDIRSHFHLTSGGGVALYGQEVAGKMSIVFCVVGYNSVGRSITNSIVSNHLI